MQRQQALQGACDALRRSYERGWISTRDGNVSVLLPGQGLWISPSGVRKQALQPEDFIPVAAASAATLAAPRRQPSGELDLHRYIHAGMPAPGCVLHVHATHVVAALFAGIRLRELALQFPEVARYTRVGPDVPALAATSAELAEATRQAFYAGPALAPHIVGLAQHGVVAVGRDAQEAFEHVERLNHICEIALLAGARALVVPGLATAATGAAEEELHG
ncbi:class II aldolase/adducin family protein [Mitsuaria sp. WAJ17]|uniref:class II aldolase/adducin family protein n=1 Tax=Mitsuaria sp. WAJ17 TaxID=2761452 RepID=UPI0015FFE2C6|nr:class II aldolase/adducin family protein [Mitsuaria sp. WAJ17]MBB2485008.1 class II aldolase/adducin family protein [Mitsuaria sp. WAJ17]